MQVVLKKKRKKEEKKEKGALFRSIRTPCTEKRGGGKNDQKRFDFLQKKKKGETGKNHLALGHPRGKGKGKKLEKREGRIPAQILHPGKRRKKTIKREKKSWGGKKKPPWNVSLPKACGTKRGEKRGGRTPKRGEDDRSISQAVLDFGEKEGERGRKKKRG